MSPNGGMRPLFRRLSVIVAVSLVCSLAGVAQTFEVGPADAPAPKQKQKQKQKKNSKSTEQTNIEEPSSIGWGAGLEVAREARAAQEALRSGQRL